jgi:acyl-coenzyme A thioesterase PaaI-like protein
MGLHLDQFDLDDGEVSAQFIPRPEYRGQSNTLHGGVAATALDEILVWAGILTEQVMAVTGTMDLRFRRPVTVDDSIVVSSRVDDRSGRRLRLSGQLTVDDEVRVSASGIYLVIADIADLLSGVKSH